LLHSAILKPAYTFSSQQSNLIGSKFINDVHVVSIDSFYFYFAVELYFLHQTTIWTFEIFSFICKKNFKYLAFYNPFRQPCPLPRCSGTTTNVYRWLSPSQTWKNGSDVSPITPLIFTCSEKFEIWPGVVDHSLIWVALVPNKTTRRKSRTFFGSDNNSTISFVTVRCIQLCELRARWGPEKRAGEICWIINNSAADYNNNSNNPICKAP